MGGMWASAQARCPTDTQDTVDPSAPPSAKRQRLLSAEASDEELDYLDLSDSDIDNDITSLLGKHNNPASPLGNNLSLQGTPGTSLLGKSDTKDVSKSQDSPQQQADAAATLLDSLAEGIGQEDKTAGSCNDKIANIANKAFTTHMSPDTIKQKQGIYLRPENCEHVVAPRLNNEIWKRVQSSHIKKRDLRLMASQTAITKSAFALIQVAESLLCPEKLQKEQTIRTCMDALVLLGHANTSISLQRRGLLRPVLKGDEALCDSSVPITSNLFGDDLSKTLKDIRQTEKLGRNPKNYWRPRNWHYRRRQSQNSPHNNPLGSQAYGRNKQTFKKRPAK